MGRKIVFANTDKQHQEYCRWKGLTDGQDAHPIIKSSAYQAKLLVDQHVAPVAGSDIVILPGARALRAVINTVKEKANGS